MRILICDDDPLITENLSKLLIDYFKKNNLKNLEIETFYSGESLLSDTGDKDIVFLDIEMPGLNGIYVGKELKKQNESVIIFIVTSYIEYLDDAMRFHVFRYLSKPIDKQRLYRNMKDAISLYTSFTKKLPIETKNGVHSVYSIELISIEAIGRKIIVHTTAADYESIHSMKYWIDMLPSQTFFQSHRSFIVNMFHITSFDHELIYLYNNQLTAYLTRRKYSSFKDTYLLYLESTR
ncbi:MAG TPA: response regulator transcription factor [Candidatus Merdenecus merdavium]|nr:response regulator transcription factor [Candidatus Merdenecus merdavium]